MKAHDTLPEKLQKYIKSKKIQVYYMDLSNIFGFIIDDDIGINKNIHFYKKRFTLAHELGHHYFGDLPKFKNKYNMKTYEEGRADNFAIQHLLPKKRLLEELETHSGDLCILEKIFGVEMKIIEKRIYQLMKKKYEKGFFICS